MAAEIKEALTFDDVTLIPDEADFLHGAADLHSQHQEWRCIYKLLLR